MKYSRILVVDDEPHVRRVLRIALVAQGFAVDDAASGEQALEKLREDPPDVILLDLKLPGMGGIQVCREIRASSDVPIIVVSARDTPELKTEAFEAGADQYATKPVGIEELVARIRAAMRRVDTCHHLVLGDIKIDFQTHDVRRDDRVVHLTATEFRLLQCLASHPGEVLAHRHILQTVWGPDYGNEVTYLRVFINQLRKKIEPDPANPRYLLTEPSAGYRLHVPPQHVRSTENGGQKHSH